MTVQTKFKVVGKTYDSDTLLLKYREILDYAVRSTMIPTIDWINTFVPKRTGQLRDDLIKWIKLNWKYNSGIMDLVTSIEYATDIHGIAAHSGTWFEHSGAPAVANYYKHLGRIYLDDPEALEFWYFLIEEFVREELRKNIIIQTDSILGS